MKIKIYQIDTEKDQHNVKFEGYERLEKYQGTRDIDASIYTEVFSGETESETLEGVYRDFNTKLQPLHRGHSLSVSDIVVTKDGAFYCDSFGFKKVDFDEQQAYRSENLLQVVYVEPNKPAYKAEIEDKLENLQRAVGGHLGIVYHSDKTCFVCNDDGKLIGLPGNRRLGDGKSIIAGAFFIVGTSGENFRSLTEEESAKYLDRFATPEEISDEEVREDTGIKFYPL